ncbi:MAG TPA: hypothetical protein VGI39_06405 [Polyangiaceae bacterium]
MPSRAPAALLLVLAPLAAACSGGHSSTLGSGASTDSGSSAPDAAVIGDDDEDATAPPPAIDANPPPDAATPATPVHANDYNRTCTTAADCVGIIDNPYNACQYCACPNAAINKADLPKEQAAADAWNATCPANPGAVCGGCPESIVVCNVELCQVEVCDGGVCPDGG